jgi:hypothetical protein
MENKAGTRDLEKRRYAFGSRGVLRKKGTCIVSFISVQRCKGTVFAFSGQTYGVSDGNN